MVELDEAEARFFVALREDQPCCRPTACDWHRYAGVRQAGMIAAISELCSGFGLMWHFVPDSRRLNCPKGFPDVVIAGPGGVIFRELKTPHHYLTPEQKTWSWTLRSAGADFKVWMPMSFRQGEVRSELAALAARQAA